MSREFRTWVENRSMDCEVMWKKHVDIFFIEKLWNFSVMQAKKAGMTDLSRNIQNFVDKVTSLAYFLEGFTVLEGSLRRLLSSIPDG